MSTVTKLALMITIAVGAVVATPKAAHADGDCLEVGWRDRAGDWQYYHAWIDAEDGNHLTLHYDYHHGILELKVFPKEKADGENVIVMKGRWYEGRESQRSGKVRMELATGHHRAKGWYTFGDDWDSAHFDFALRECRH